MGYVDIFRKLWGWLSGETGVVETGSSSLDKVDFVATTEGTFIHTTTDKGKFIHTVTDEIDF